MEKLSELSGLKQWGVVIAGAAVVTGALYFVVFKGQVDANATAQQALEAKVRENTELQSYQPKLAEMDRQVASLKQQLEIERHIVPDDKEADTFIRMLDAEAAKAGIEIRAYTALPVSSKEFYSEVPFALELDGPYYSVLKFFEQVGNLERIVNVSNLLVASTKKPGDAKVKHIYDYAPSESVVVTCTATTFFSHDMQPPASPPARGARR
jgi:type IV pilus assembly protein PilO